MKEGGSHKKRGRDEREVLPLSVGRSHQEKQQQQRLLRCPWCSDGYLLQPPADTDADGVERATEEVEVVVEGHLCTNRTACPHRELLWRDTSMAFSGIRAEGLLRRFYGALDAHLQLCERDGESPQPRRGGGCAWSIVAERSPLFVAMGEERALAEEEEEGCAWPPRFDANAPVFYFLVCEDCGEKVFVC
ncbi:hypothetical protein DQ04_03141020 [Trypanosoma grayi]|uniref:hypothetical protein n=1 Tax=Trypanosoma grayi TaxID=71804 RepID=UPI0004F44B8F|nr:hypothetical protein DQ04_03141020 [Trypanosoma grayi]KEG10930.1 hypothetical protein DQ04_03141020 [Trypanosoma grayi]